MKNFCLSFFLCIFALFEGEKRLSIFALLNELNKILLNELNKIMKDVSFKKSDLKLIGHTCYEESNNLAVVCYLQTCGIEEILLRNILKCFGQEYKIIAKEDADDENVVYITNLSYEEFKRLW